jgi:hypothetical protein
MTTRNAVLMLVFNRPDVTQKVFEAVRQARPPRLYVAADGARADRPADLETTAQVRSIFNEIDWPCEVHTRFLDQNLGCRMAVSSAIDWFFKQEEQGIVLEDDTLPNTSFFEFCDAMLDRYKNDMRIFSVCGSNLAQPWFRSQQSYEFTRYMCVWGWASWRRAWNHYDEALQLWPTVKTQPNALPLMPAGFARRFWSLVFDLVYLRSIGTWDHQWVFAHWKNNGLSIVPARNMVVNLGFGEGATNTSGATPNYVQLMKHNKQTPPFARPADIQENGELSLVIERHIHRVNLLTLLKLGVRKYPHIFVFLKKYVESFRRWKVERQK